MNRPPLVRMIGLLVILAAIVRGQGAPEPAPATARSRFTWVDAYVDAGPERLAAYQFELVADTGAASVVGIGGGDGPAFAEPPYYDPRAMGQGRVILGAFNTSADLPAGRVRVARVNLEVRGRARPRYAAKLVAAADAAGRPIRGAAVTIVEGAAP